MQMTNIKILNEDMQNKHAVDLALPKRVRTIWVNKYLFLATPKVVSCMELPTPIMASLSKSDSEISR